MGEASHHLQYGNGGKRWEYLCPLQDTVADYAECMAEAVEILEYC